MGLVASFVWFTAVAAPLPDPATDVPKATVKGQATAVFAGGCFWGVDAVFANVKGVTSATSGYSGGASKTARYEFVGTGSTGHAEAVQVVYDPRRSPTVSCCGYFSPSRTIRHSSTARVPTLDRSIARRFFTPIRNSNGWRKPISRSWNKPKRSRGRSLPKSRARRVLSGRGLSPELSGTASREYVHRHQRPAQARRAEEAVPRSVCKR
jgi:hypothetical protein